MDVGNTFSLYLDCLTENLRNLCLLWTYDEEAVTYDHMTQDDERPKRMSALQKAREMNRLRMERLSEIPVELQVTDGEHAKSPEVIEFAIKHLTSGGTWGELRRKLGLGPAYADRRWRILRETVSAGLVPKSEEEALQAQTSMRSFLLNRIEEYLDDLEGLLSSMGNSDEDKKSLAPLMKARLDALKVLLDENNKAFESYVDLLKVKQADKKTQGPSIVVQYNYHIPRPGDNREAIKDVTPTIQNLQVAKRESGN